MKKQSTSTRPITGRRVEERLKHANKLISLKLCSVEQRKAYFTAVETLRELSDEYCEITGLPLV